MYCSSRAPTLVPLVQKGLCYSWSSIDHAGHGNNTEFGGEIKSALTHNVTGKWSALADCRTTLMVCCCYVATLLVTFGSSAPD